MKKRWRMADGRWRMERRRLALRPLLSALCLLLLLLTGCGGEGYLTHLMSGGDKVPAYFTLDERPTLIFVDDPGEVMTDPNLALTIAINVEFNFKQNKVLVDKIIPSSRISELQSKYGEDFKTIPVDALGRELGAEQVVYVLIDDASFEQVPGMYRPRASMQVKVIDAVTGKRLYPDPQTPNQPRSPDAVRGHKVATEMKFQGNANSQGELTLMKRKLAEIMGRDVAHLFYRWKPTEIGHRFEEE